MFSCLLQTLANCREKVCKELDIPVEECELSMGMSGDFELAVSHHMNLVFAIDIRSAGAHRPGNSHNYLFCRSFDRRI